MSELNIPNEPDIWQRLKEETQPIIIYGTGNGADKILDELLRIDVTVQGFMASDDFVRGQHFRGYSVKKLSDLEKEYGSLLILIAFGTQRPEVMDNIVRIAERHTVLCPDVPVYGEKIFHKSYVLQHKDELKRVYDLLSDELSRQTFQNVIRFRLSGELSTLTSVYSPKEEVFQNILHLTDDEYYLDLGAYRGDTIDEFLTHTNDQYRGITALEPDAKTYQKLKLHVSSMPCVQTFKMGIWSENTDLPFDASLGRGSSMSAKGSTCLPVTTIDTLFAKRNVSYLKMDVEGAESEAITGGKMVIARDRPKLNIALYHRTEDIFHLPLLLHSIQPSYRFYIRQHPHIPDWDLNLYAI